MRKGYTLLPEEELESLCDSNTSHVLAVNSIELGKKTPIALPLFVADEAAVDMVAGSVPIDDALCALAQDVAGGSAQKGYSSDEIEYTLEIDLASIQERYEMIGIEKEESEVDKIDRAGQYIYEITADSAKYIAKCATVDNNSYIVLSDEGNIYSINQSCTVRKPSDKRLEE
ncbi:uncharacterized protein NEMAJ01_1230 [Nematocida major]|uniref:uncharacterized protein n=1 Tax=Nematocida major TaxID=1912982 RepID=UPI00200894D0|nr:uncharacterized protein NEMAJ01_1230 [Nematocida major]KAH9386334.1 hypothetical protein NEMAJ01_1230 [Nematocida major]